MKRLSWEVKLGVGLVVLSLLLNGVLYALFHDMRHIVLWGMTSLAFLPLSVLFVTLFIDQLMIRRERNARLEKLNMLIGTFFSSVGRELMARFAASDPEIGAMRGEIGSLKEWSDAKCRQARQRLQDYKYTVEPTRIDFAGLKEFLASRTDLLLRLLENPNLLEHERFADLLRAVFHLAEELAMRPGLSDLPASDLQHLAGDSTRAYRLIVGQWLEYMSYLKRAYPYLFSLALRTNPFDPEASVIVR